MNLAEKSSFFNSVDHDRQYKAEDWAEYFAEFIGNGIFPNPGVGLSVTASGTDMALTISTGSAYINGYRYANTSDALTVTLETAPAALKRIDRVVVRWDRSTRSIYAAISKGTESTSPSPPTLLRNADKWELCLATVAVGAGATYIEQTSVTDTRMDSDVCGVVTGTVTQIDFSTVFAQYNAAFDAAISENIEEIDSWKIAQQTSLAAWQAERVSAFESWFDGIQTTLSEDTAGNLQTQIDNKVAGTSDVATLTAAGWAESGTVYQQTVGVPGVKADEVNNHVFVGPAPACYDEYTRCNVRVSAKSTGTLTFVAKRRPTTALAAQVLILDSGV